MFWQKKQVKKGWKKRVGMRCETTNGDTFKYLLLYDVDYTNDDWENYNRNQSLMEILHDFQTSYLVYETLNGLHVVGLTPLDFEQWSSMLTILKREIPEYYSGIIIRVSRKEGETQKLLSWNFDYPIIPNLIEIYAKRLFQGTPIEFYESFQKQFIVNDKWRLVFEKYWSMK